MTTLRIAREGSASPDALISEHVATMLHRTRWTVSDLAREVGMTKQTLGRKVAGGTSWYYAEVELVAQALGVTVPELATGLPTLEEWKTRWDDLRACRDSNPKPSDLESRGVPVRHLRLLPPVRSSLTANRLTLVGGPVALEAVI